MTDSYDDTGVTEGTIQWVTYEYLKLKFAEKRERRQIKISDLTQSNDMWSWFDKLASAALSKLIAACISYPHEVYSIKFWNIKKTSIC